MKIRKLIKVGISVLCILPITLQTTGCKSNTAIIKPGNEINATSPYFNATGYPIIKEKINIKAVIVTGNSWDYNDSSFMKMMEDKTNIHFDFEQIPSGGLEKLKLKFASRNFPDVMFRTDLPQAYIYDAAQSGDVIALDPLIEKYSPNWTKLFKEQPDIRQKISAPDGHIYSLPNVSQNKVAMGIRDQWFINNVWLKELNLKIPTTLDEYINALRAFRDNAGKGSIPVNVIPWYFQWDAYTGGPLDVFGAFGVLVPDNSYLVVKDGKVASQFLNPDIKRPLQFFQQAYKEKLFPPEAFVDTDWASYADKSESVPAILGSYHGFNKHIDEKYYERMAPPKVPGVERAYYREQFNGSLRFNQFTIFKKCKYPEALVRWADLMGDPDISVQSAYGLIDENMVGKADGKYKIGYGENKKVMIPGVDMIQIITGDMSEKFDYNPSSVDYQRKLGVEFYAPYMAPKSMYFPLVKYTNEENSELQKLNTDIQSYVKTTYTKWITEGTDINAQWDGYVAKLKEMKIDEMLKINQAAYDRNNQNK